MTEAERALLLEIAEATSRHCVKEGWHYQADSIREKAEAVKAEDKERD